MKPELNPGTLYLVATPIGNLEDITFRAVRILQEVDLIAAEDTRHTGHLLHHFQITTPQISYHEHNQKQRIPELINHLTSGKNIALVTDAGMPGISDPGTELVQACQEAQIRVIPIPGPSASLTALSASGLPTNRFTFEGFLPVKGKERMAQLESLKTEPRTMILYESPHRLRQTLADLRETLGNQHLMTIARELTKIHEEFWHGTLESAIAEYEQREPQGEYTLILAGCLSAPIVLSEAEIKAELKVLLQQGLSRSQASRQLAQQIGKNRRDVYQIALTISDSDSSN